MDPGETIAQQSPPFKITEKQDGTEVPRGKMDSPKSDSTYVSMKSNASMGHPMNLKKESPSHYSRTLNMGPGETIAQQRPPFKISEKQDGTEVQKTKPITSYVSMKSNASMGHPMNLKKETPSHYSSLQDLPSPCVSCESNSSRGHPENFKDEHLTFDWSSKSLHSPDPASVNLKVEPPRFHCSLQQLHLLEDPKSLSPSDQPKDLPLKSKHDHHIMYHRHVPSPTGPQPKDFNYRSLAFHRSPQPLLSPESEHSPTFITRNTLPDSPLSKDEGSSLDNSFHELQSPEPHPSSLTEEHLNIHSPQPLLSPDSEHSLMSMMSDESLGSPFSPRYGNPYDHSSFQDLPSPYVSCESKASRGHPENFKDEHSTVESLESLSSDFSSHCQMQLEPIFVSLKKNLIHFVEDELQKFDSILRTGHLGCSESLTDADDVQKQENETAFLKITQNFLKQMNLKELADVLQSKGEATEMNEEHEVRQIETAFRKPNRGESRVRCNNIFKGSKHRGVRTVLTKGVAGIRKTVLTQKFCLDWAESKANQDKYFVFPFTFRQLNLVKDKTFSLVELVHHFFSETKDVEVSSFQDLQVVFIFDGLDECRFPLEFQKAKTISSVTESASVDELLTNLIRRDLLPSALIWITTRPAAANQIPAEYVSMVTEVRGFTNPQKEQYFKKKFSEDQALTVISHIKSSQSMYIMCHIPIFCWIAAIILQNVMKSQQAGRLPKTLTEMYIHFLVVQAKVKNVKYDRKSETDEPWSPESRKMIESLAKLAFEQLQKGNLIFYESDLSECGIDITAASVYSGVFTEIFKEESGLYQNKVYCFIHLSIQEFLAALHVHLTFVNSGVNLLCENQSPVKSESAEVLFYQTAIDKALQSHNGHLDLFLRFLLGLSLETNQILLHGLLPKPNSSSKTNKETVKFIKETLNQNVSVERCINLFHCLSELNDRSLVNQIQWYLNSGQLKVDELSSSQWSALVFILLSSERELFDLKEYCASEEGLIRLLPVVNASKKALLSGCSLSKRSCRYLSSLLSSKSCCLKELDLSNNNLTDSGMEALAPGLKSPHCKLETLRLSGCLITEEGCTTLASALKCNPSHLKVLDLSYNHPGNKGLKEVFGLQGDPQCNLETLSVDPAGLHWMIPDLMKYFTKITLNPNTVNKCLQLSNYNKKVTHALKDLSYAEHPDRFDYWHQVLSSSTLTDRCYQEVEWTGEVEIAVTYKRIKRKGPKEDCRFGANDHSWRLRASPQDCYMCHDSNRVPVKPIFPNRVGVYVDHSAGVLSFFSVSADQRFHLCTINTTFTEPMYLGIGLRIVPPPLVSSVVLRDLSDEISTFV